ncbi:MAG: hypothetical protein ACE5I7_05855 [Candidatus Binatia bacterium]
MDTKRFLEVMADLEARIAKIYERFATEFHDVADVGDLWVSMGREELHHADHLSLAASAATPDPVAAAMAEHVMSLETVVAQHEREVAHAVPLQEALQVTVELEEAEAAHLHAPLSAMSGWAGRLAQDPVMQHRQHHLLEHAVGLFGTPAVQARLAGQLVRA